MLSYMLPTTEEKPPSSTAAGDHPTPLPHHHNNNNHHQQHHHPHHPGYRALTNSNSSIARYPPSDVHGLPRPCTAKQRTVTRATSSGPTMFGRHHEDDVTAHQQPPRPGSAAPLLPPEGSSPKHNGTTTTATTTTVRKSTLHTAKVAKDDSLYSIDSDASTVGSDRKGKMINGPKHANLKRVSFGSSKGSMVETLVYETPVQEEPEINHFLEHNGRLPAPMIPVPDTDEGREKVRVSLLGPTPFPSTPGVLLLEPIGPPVDIMAASPAELLTAHTDHTIPTYHTQISTDSGWDNPFRPDGDLSREADEIVELIKGGKPITPTPGQNAPALPGSKTSGQDQHDSSSSPLLDATNNLHNTSSASPRLSQGNGNAHSTPIKPSNNQQPVNEKNTATVEVGRVTAAGPGDASQVEHVTLKKKPKCKCCVLQ